MSRIKSRSEQRLEQLEALERPLTEDEGVELRKCLHAIYMQRWRAEAAEREMNEAALKEHRICHESMVRAEIDGIASRMEAAFDNDWPLVSVPYEQWQEHARHASALLRDTILNAQAKQRERIAA
jgi:hypothetical protein